MLPVSSPQDWQDLLDEKFPQGAQINYVVNDGLSDYVYNVPYLVVVEMLEEGPLLRGLQLGEERDLLVPVRSWQESDRSGHHVVRVTTVDDLTLEFSSWLSPVQVEALSKARPEHMQALQEASPAFQSGEIVATLAETNSLPEE